MMKLAILGPQTFVNNLSIKTKGNIAFNVIGTYSTDKRSMKVGLSSIISPFGLINQSDCVIIYKTDDVSLNFIVEAIKNATPILIYNPHEITKEEGDELLRLSSEADSLIFVHSGYNMNSFVTDFKQSCQKPQWIDLIYGTPIEHKEMAIGETLSDLLHVSLTLVNSGVKKINTFISPVQLSQIFQFIIECNNGAIISCRSIISEAEPVSFLTVYEKDKKTSINFEQNQYNEFYFNETKKNKDLILPKVDIDLLMLEHFFNALSLEPSSLRSLYEYKNVLAVKKNYLDKISLYH